MTVILSEAKDLNQICITAKSVQDSSAILWPQNDTSDILRQPLFSMYFLNRPSVIRRSNGFYHLSNISSIKRRITAAPAALVAVP